MDLLNTKLSYTCPNCQKRIILTFHTTQCPKCHVAYLPKNVKQIFYDYESHVENSAFTQFGNDLQATGNVLKETGNVISAIGCVVFGIPFLILIFKLLSLF